VLSHSAQFNGNPELPVPAKLAVNLLLAFPTTSFAHSSHMSAYASIRRMRPKRGWLLPPVPG